MTRNLLTLGFALAWLVARGQTAPDQPRFEAASVKPTAPPSLTNRGSVHADATRIDYHAIALKSLIMEAYPLPDYEIIWPTGMGGYFDVSATMRAGTTRDQFRLMLQHLLSERFNLSAHTETRSTKVYALEISPSGLNLRKAENPPGVEGGHVIHGTRNGKGGKADPEWFWTSRWPGDPESIPSGMTISELAKYFTNNNYLDRPLMNTTGLDGYYDIDLSIPRGLSAGDPLAGPGGRQLNRPNGPELLDAMEKQLGLRAEAKTLPVEVLVIDHLQNIPTAN